MPQKKLTATQKLLAVCLYVWEKVKQPNILGWTAAFLAAAGFLILQIQGECTPLASVCLLVAVVCGLTAFVLVISKIKR